MIEEANMDTTEKPTPTANRIMVALVVALAAVPAACCDGGPLEPNTEGCMFDEAAATENAVAVLEISGGLTGVNDEYVIRADGTVKYVNRLSGNAAERAVPGGADRAAQLVADLTATRVRNGESGCYLPESESADSLVVRITLRHDGRLFFYGSECDAGPPELLGAIELLKAYVNEAL
jgi:hypothetical protein